MAEGQGTYRNVVLKRGADGRILISCWMAGEWRRISNKTLQVWHQRDEYVIRYWPDRQTAEAWCFIPEKLKKSVKQRRRCRHKWRNISWYGAYRSQTKAAWNHRCEHCGGFSR